MLAPTCKPETPGDDQGRPGAHQGAGRAPETHRECTGGEGALRAETKLKGSVPDP